MIAFGWVHVAATGARLEPATANRTNLNPECLQPAPQFISSRKWWLSELFTDPNPMLLFIT
jgi:hypothetical protein